MAGSWGGSKHIWCWNCKCFAQSLGGWLRFQCASVIACSNFQYVFLHCEVFGMVRIFYLFFWAKHKFKDTPSDSRSIYPLLLIYAASTSTTTLACLSLILSTPLTSPSTLAEGVISITGAQRSMLLSSYIPFFLVPLLMSFDMAGRVARLVRLGIKAEQDAKRK
jgi:hypothetical protein